MIIKKDLHCIADFKNYSSCRLFPARKNYSVRLSQYLSKTSTVWFFHYNELVESQSTVIRSLIDTVVEKINPRRHMSGVLAAARRIFSKSSGLSELAGTGSMG